ncbi:hypothetical protein, partial [Pantoea ananatis]|uniref:hypothetical protein n=1 Tax=Pantoea ananas TaxID=553 RepID=UPI002362B19D
ADITDYSRPNALNYAPNRYGYDRATLSADRRFGPLSLAWTASLLNERGTVLGAHFGDALGAAQATSWFV